MSDRLEGNMVRLSFGRHLCPVWLEVAAADIYAVGESDISCSGISAPCALNFNDPEPSNGGID